MFYLLLPLAANFCIRAVRSASNIDPVGMLDEPGASISLMAAKTPS